MSRWALGTTTHLDWGVAGTRNRAPDRFEAAAAVPVSGARTPRQPASEMGGPEAVSGLYLELKAPPFLAALSETGNGCPGYIARVAGTPQSPTRLAARCETVGNLRLPPRATLATLLTSGDDNRAPGFSAKP